MAVSNNLSQRAFAAAVGLSRGRISQLVAEGLPRSREGRFDLEEGRRWIATNIDRDRWRGGGRKPGTPRAKPASKGILATVSSLRGHKLVREAQLLDLELRKKNGEVVDRAEVERAVFDRARFERDSWLAFPSRAAAVLAAEAGIDPGRAFPVLDRLVREHLGELAARPLDSAASSQ